MKSFPACYIEGGLFSPDLFDQLISQELPGQRPADFGLKAGKGLTDEIAAVFKDAEVLWKIFNRRLERLSEKDLGTSITRDAWCIPLLTLLGHSLHYNRRAYKVGGLTFHISHRSGEPEDAPPVHIVGIRQELGRIPPSGRPRLAPHSLVQEYLNRTDALWGIVTNGKVLRILRDSTYIRRQCYVEFDLEAIFDQRLFQDFSVLYRLIHRSRFPRDGKDIHQCLLEKYYQHSLEQGGRVKEKLRDGVEKAIIELANGFLAHPKNQELRNMLSNSEKEGKRISPGDFYRELLRLIYRFLFLLVSEDRGLLSQNPIYLNYYGVGRLRRLVDNKSAYTNHPDIWHSFRVLWKLLSDDTPVLQAENRPLADILGLPVLNGQLFEPLEIDRFRISNRDLLSALWFLINYQEGQKSPRRINYAALDVEELGSVYESLLDFQPTITTSQVTPRFKFVKGTERKSTGSYYTPSALVHELIHSALEPVLEERLKSSANQKEKEEAILSIKVVDPACGSGHFLLAAARRLGKELASVRTGQDEPPPEEVRLCTRDVISHCIYGVDKNPLAVELCRVALWLEAHSPGRPLTFLDHRIRCGDSLVGVFSLDELKKGIPKEAFDAVSGDDKELVKKIKKSNREELKALKHHQGLLPFDDQRDGFNQLVQEAKSIDQMGDESLEAIRKKKRLYREMELLAERQRIACDLWTAAFFQPRRKDTVEASIITTETLRKFLSGANVNPQALAQAQTLSHEHRFFHWPLEFPEIWETGGFDVVLGNPPWEQIQLQEKEFFATRDQEIAGASNAAARKRLIKKLAEKKPELWEEYRNALHFSESLSRFMRASGQYLFTASGKINTYSVFSERMRRLVGHGGRAGLIVPTGIATDNTNKEFFGDLVSKGEISSLYDFENRKAIFPHVHRSYKFSLLTMKRIDEQKEPADEQKMRFAFFCTSVEQLRDDKRVFELSPEDITRINPNTRTLPIFRTRQDAEMTKAIYHRVPVLINEVRGENPWRLHFRQGLFNMSSASHLFRTKDSLESEGFSLKGNRFVGKGLTYLPLYEAKMIWHFDHRFGTFEGVESRKNTHLPSPDPSQHADPSFLVLPWYWVAEKEVNNKIGNWGKGWLMGFRRIARSTDERTAIFSLLPKVGAGDVLPILRGLTGKDTLLCSGCLNSLSSDYVTRQKIGGTHLDFHYLKQLPVLPPSAYKPLDLAFIIPRVLELTYTAWDIKPFADDVWNDIDEGLRREITRQWNENKRETGGHNWELPDWIDAYPEIETDPQRGIPFTPFKWDENRRARLRAELDTWYARLYGLSRKQLRYILDPRDLTERELENILDPWEEVDDPLEPEGYLRRCKESDFPGETFRVLKDKEIRTLGEYRTRRLVLEAWERLNR